VAKRDLLAVFRFGEQLRMRAINEAHEHERSEQHQAEHEQDHRAAIGSGAL